MARPTPAYTTSHTTGNTSIHPPITTGTSIALTRTRFTVATPHTEMASVNTLRHAPAAVAVIHRLH